MTLVLLLMAQRLRVVGVAKKAWEYSPVLICKSNAGDLSRIIDRSSRFEKI